MYVVYELNPDGDRITLFNDMCIEEAKEVFDDACSGDCETVVMAEVTPGETFGFGAMGDFLEARLFLNTTQMESQSLLSAGLVEVTQPYVTVAKEN